MTIPNCLTILRLLLVPAFLGVFFAFPQEGIWAAGILLLSGATDVLDGWIARKFHQTSQLGKILDPFADKLTQLSVCVCLAIRHKEFIIILCLLILKEFIMLIAGFHLIRKGVKLPSSKWFGKVSTVVFYLVMPYIVYEVDISNFWLALLAWTAVVFAAAAFLQYIPEYLKLRAQVKKDTP